MTGCFESLPETPKASGIWCASSLLHVPREDFSQTLVSLYKLLEVGGRFYYTVRIGEKSKWDKYDEATDDAERFIQLYPEDFLLNETREAGFKIQKFWVEDSYWGRPSKWFSLIATK